MKRAVEEQHSAELHKKCRCRTNSTLDAVAKALAVVLAWLQIRVHRREHRRRDEDDDTAE
jgi:hypothetical protein